MVTVEFDPLFEKKVKKIKHELQKLKIKKQIAKILQVPEVGKPMKYGRKGAREVYIPPYRLSYMYLKDEDKIIFLDLYHKDKQ